MKKITVFSDADKYITDTIQQYFESAITRILKSLKSNAYPNNQIAERFTLFIFSSNDSLQRFHRAEERSPSFYIHIDNKPLFFNEKSTLILSSKEVVKEWQRKINLLVEKSFQQSTEQLFAEFATLNLRGRSSQFINIIKNIKKLAQCNAPLLIKGETGTGKENTARAIHYLSTRKDNAFVPINCGAIAENLIETELFGYEQGAYTGAEKSKEGLVDIAHNGTLFLDEVDSLSAKAQTVLLRFLQTGEYRAVGGRTLKKSNVHIITATNACLETNIKQQTFRQDLYFRLNVLTIDLPPLRERPDDIQTIADNLMKKMRIEHNAPNKFMGEGFMHWLKTQRWTGNIRELENTLLREFLLSTSDMLEPPETASTTEQASLSFKAAKNAAIEEFEISYIQNVLSLTHGNVSHAAKIAGKERRAFGKLLKKYHIERMQWANNAGKPI